MLYPHQLPIGMNGRRSSTTTTTTRDARAPRSTHGHWIQIPGNACRPAGLPPQRRSRYRLKESIRKFLQAESINQTDTTRVGTTLRDRYQQYQAGYLYQQLTTLSPLGISHTSTGSLSCSNNTNHQTCQLQPTHKSTGFNRDSAFTTANNLASMTCPPADDAHVTKTQDGVTPGKSTTGSNTCKHGAQDETHNEVSYDTTISTKQTTGMLKSAAIWLQATTDTMLSSVTSHSNIMFATKIDLMH
ncbi:hypothetical protein SEMRO_2060_G312920.1 [Seminavis robusta]|uniref:Uncharacterized protein n=1 Tax=Seminavis robusta TaxID=568900 RepID=A0A9N8EV03_9STRA|nr:hypothetical protein SEMRO_2060_G312920.1 [Seminavis robusta]|eukprot:Sro2060_g312920.1 n/a (244) ;mRNA; f:8756-9487